MARFLKKVYLLTSENTHQKGMTGLDLNKQANRLLIQHAQSS